MGNVTYRNVDLGYLQSFTITDDAGITTFPYPCKDTGDNPVFNLGGKTTRVSVTTLFEGTDAEIVSKISDIKALINGSDSGGSLVLPYESFNAMMKKFSRSATVSNGITNLISFSFEFVIGHVISICD